jgi:hypothetical protein
LPRAGLRHKTTLALALMSLLTAPLEHEPEAQASRPDA